MIELLEFGGVLIVLCLIIFLMIRRNDGLTSEKQPPKKPRPTAPPPSQYKPPDIEPESVQRRYIAVYTCVKCEGELSNHQMMYSNGVCPLCGNAEGHTVVKCNKSSRLDPPEPEPEPESQGRILRP